MTWTVRILNWREFQHYKNRGPPWIKLHRQLALKPSWRRLRGSAAKLLVDLWMLGAGDDDGEIGMTLQDIAYYTRQPQASVVEDLNALTINEFVALNKQTLAAASNVQSLAVPEERRGETEAETEQSRALVELRSTPGLPAVGAVESQTHHRETVEAALHLAAETIFVYWQAKLGHPGALLDRKRSAKLEARLRENGGDVSELLYAVDGALRDDWLMGRDPKAPRRYDGIETVFRDRAQVERLVATAPGRNGPHPFLAQPVP
jgi:hypothetical protein